MGMKNRHGFEFGNETRLNLFIPVAALVILVLTACASQAGANPPSSIEPLALSPSDDIGGTLELIEALRSQNAAIELMNETDPSYFDVQGQVITVNGVEVQIFEFVNVMTRENAEATISPDGTSIGTTMVNWIDQPNFWAKGRVIVLYVGRDASIIELFTAVLGEPIIRGLTPAGHNDLVNTKWELISFGWPGSPTGVETRYVNQHSLVTLEFGPAGQAGGSGGCNFFSAQYEVQAGELSLSQITSTLMACEAEDIDQQEQKFLQALENAAQFEQTADHLVIWYGSDQEVLFFFPWRESDCTPTPTVTPGVPEIPTGVPTAPPSQTTPAPERIIFKTGTTSAVVSGILQPSGSELYVLRALSGQTMTVELSFTEGRAILAIWGKDGTVLLSDHAETANFQGVLPSTQDYFILLKGRPDGNTLYSMKITIPPRSNN